jgi:hypothetical protein
MSVERWVVSDVVITKVFETMLDPTGPEWNIYHPSAKWGTRRGRPGDPG